MPLYDVRCEICKKEFEHFCKVAEITTIVCDCGGRCKTLITNYHSQDWFRPHLNPNFDTDPVYVTSRSHMKQLCKKYNLTSRALGDCRGVSEV